MLEFKDEAAIVPGTCSGIGRTCAQFYARDGGKGRFSVIIKCRLERSVLAAEPAV